MAKVTLGKRPKNFPLTVKFTMLDGEPGAIAVSYRYRTKTEYGQFIDAIQAAEDAAKKAAGVAPDPAPESFSLERVLEKAVGSNGAYLTEILDGWDLDIPLDKESAQQLADELPAAATAIMEGYRAAILEGRLGN